MGRRTGVSSKETRQALLDAAIRVLLARGYEGTRVSEIAREAGVTSGAIYNHFESKADLLGAAIAEQAPDVITTLLAAGDGSSVLSAFRQHALELSDPDDALGPLVLELVMTATRDPEVAAIVRPRFAARDAAAADVIRLAQDSGTVDAGLDAEALARFTTLVVLGSLVAGALDLKPVDATAWGGVIDRMLAAAEPTATTSTKTRTRASRSGGPT